LNYFSDRYNDIIQTNIEEGDDHQSTKQLLASLMWIHERCPLARFIAFTNGELLQKLKSEEERPNWLIFDTFQWKLS